MGLFSSKIPSPKPGQILFYVGIPNVDEFYSNLEYSIKMINDLRVELDTRTTDLIKCLGASSVWECNPDIETILRILLTVFAVLGNGYTDNAATISKSPPYITPKPIIRSRKLRKLVQNFENFMETVTSLENRLLNCSVTDLEVSNSKRIQRKITKYTIKENYAMKDKMEALKIVNENHQKIKEAPSAYSEMMKIYSEVPRLFSRVVEESRLPPFSTTLLQRGIQGSSENLKNPESIVKKFWPII